MGHAVGVSRDGRWVVTADGYFDTGELSVCEVETGAVTIFEGRSPINCIDISADCTLLATGSYDYTVRIWSLDAGKPIAGPFRSADEVGAVRFTHDSKKLVVKLLWWNYLEVWDIQSQKLDVKVGNFFFF